LCISWYSLGPRYFLRVSKCTEGITVSSAWKPLEGSAQAIALEVLVYGPLARSELARRVGLSQASLTRLANPLVASGLLVEVEAASDGTRMGRPTRPLDIVPTSHHFVGSS